MPNVSSNKKTFWFEDPLPTCPPAQRRHQVELRVAAANQIELYIRLLVSMYHAKIFRGHLLLETLVRPSPAFLRHVNQAS